MIQILKAKIFDEKNNILKKYLNKKFIQKYLTQEEIEFVEKLQGNSWEEKLLQLKKFQSIKTQSKQKNKSSPLYVYNGIKFFSAIDIANHIYCEENQINSLQWLYKTKGKNFLKNFKKKRESDIKRKILEVSTEEEIPIKIYEKRNSNIKIKFYCKNCGVVDFQSPKTVLHFNNLLCGSCRRKLLKK